jgi:hypothetical protein
LQGHVISLSLHEWWHLSRKLRTFLARLIVPFSSSELDLRAAAHIQRSGRSPRRYGVYSYDVSHCLQYGSAAPTDLCHAPHRRAGRANDLLRLRKMILSYRKPQRSYR